MITDAYEHKLLADCFKKKELLAEIRNAQFYSHSQ